MCCALWRNTFFMYLQQLFRQSKFWFLVIIVFITGQLFINYKRGVVFTPLFHYGMYSAVISPEKNYTVTEIFVNGRRLAAKDFSSQEWDNIVLPAEKFYMQQQWNSLNWNNDIRRMLHLHDSSAYTNSLTEAAFKKWYAKRLTAITGIKTDSFRIAFTPYVFNGQNLAKENRTH